MTGKMLDKEDTKDKENVVIPRLSSFFVAARAFTADMIAYPVWFIFKDTDPWRKLIDSDGWVDRGGPTLIKNDEDYTVGWLPPFFEPDKNELDNPIDGHMYLIVPEMCIPAKLPLLEVLDLFKNPESAFFFLLSGNHIGSYVDRYCFNKLPMTGCLLLLMLDLENKINTLINGPEGRPGLYEAFLIKNLTPSRFNRLAEKMKQIKPNLDAGTWQYYQELSNFLTIGDKLYGLYSFPHFIEELPFTRAQYFYFQRLVEKTRNRIAHAGPIIPTIFEDMKELNDLIAQLIIMTRYIENHTYAHSDSDEIDFFPLDFVQWWGKMLVP